MSREHEIANDRQYFYIWNNRLMSEWIEFFPVARQNFGATMTDNEKEAWRRHVPRLSDQVRAGYLTVAGPTRGKINTGIGIFVAPAGDAALDIMKAIPTIMSGFATRELRPFRATFTRRRENS
jgi:uncharacterized protein YciI